MIVALNMIFFLCVALVNAYVSEYLLGLDVSSCVIAGEESILEELALERIDLLPRVEITLLARLVSRCLHSFRKLLRVANQSLLENASAKETLELTEAKVGR